ncbi:MAG: GNAT family N-acetyltransferase [Flavobacteriaceae bacterium]
MELQLVKSPQEIETTHQLAQEIWTQHYTPIIGIDQVNYMLANIQSLDAIKDHISTGQEYFLIKDQGLDVGYFSIYEKGKMLFLSKLYVKKGCRGKGLGKFAMNFMEKQALERKLKGIELTVNKYNDKTIEAYKKLGFVQTMELVQDIGNGFVMDDYVLVKILES